MSKNNSVQLCVQHIIIQAKLESHAIDKIGEKISSLRF